MDVERLLGFEEEDSTMTEVKVYEVLRFMRHERTKVAANNAVPGSTLSRVEFFLDVLSNVLEIGESRCHSQEMTGSDGGYPFNSALLHGLGRDFNDLGLHIFTL